MYASELFEQNKPRVVVTYPGRFQPFHQGHAGVFAQLQKQFGADNVFVVTSNDTSSAKSPFNFSDKYQLITAAGVPANHIVQTNKMYILPDGFDPRSTVFVTAVGAPDKDRLNPDTYTKRDQKDKDGNVIKPAGSPSYYRTWDAKQAPVTADQHGYVVVIPEIKKSVVINKKSYDASHGTEVRNLWNMVRDNNKAREEFLQQLYKNAHRDLIAIFNKIPVTVNESAINEFAAGGGSGSGNYFQELASAWYNGAYDSGSLQKGIKTNQDIERLLQRGIVAPDGKTRKYNIDYNSDFDGVIIFSDDYYEHSDYDDAGREVDSRTGQPWGPYDYMEFKDEELDEGVAEARDGDTNFGHTVTRGSWVVYNGSKVKRFKTHTGAKAYAEKNGGKVASSEFYADKIQKPDVAEGSDDPFGSQGRFVGDTGPAQVSTTVLRVQLRIGDRVVYKPTEQRASIEAMSRDGTQARIHIATPMGGRTFNCKTADLKALGRNVAEGFNSKQEVIDYFVKQGKSAAQGAAAWERGYRGPQPKSKSHQPPKAPDPQQHYWWQDKDEVTEEAAGVGVVAKNKKMARDPRYSMSITKDVKPSTPKNMLRAFRLAETWAQRRRIAETDQGISKAQMMSVIKKFLPLAMQELKIDKLPHIVLQPEIEAHDGQATFGRFVNEEEKIYLALANRHPVDILRTLAHELVHYKQYEDGKMYPGAGETGSPIENQAHMVAGVIMRHFNKKYPNAMKLQQLELGK